MPTLGGSNAPDARAIPSSILPRQDRFWGASPTPTRFVPSWRGISQDELRRKGQNGSATQRRSRRASTRRHSTIHNQAPGETASPEVQEQDPPRSLLDLRRGSGLSQTNERGTHVLRPIPVPLDGRDLRARHQTVPQPQRQNEIQLNLEELAGARAPARELRHGYDHSLFSDADSSG